MSIQIKSICAELTCSSWNCHESITIDVPCEDEGPRDIDPAMVEADIEEIAQERGWGPQATCPACQREADREFSEDQSMRLSRV